MNGKLRVAKLALNERCRRFELRRGATSAINCLQQVCSVLLRYFSEVQLRDRRNCYLTWKFLTGNLFDR